MRITNRVLIGMAEVDVLSFCSLSYLPFYVTYSTLLRNCPEIAQDFSIPRLGMVLRLTSLALSDTYEAWVFCLATTAVG